MNTVRDLPTGSAPPCILVVTVVHHPLDARIYHRQIDALLGAGWRVTYAAPWKAYGIIPSARAGFRAVDLPRAKGRRRMAAQVSARRLLRRLGPDHDLILFHDPELVLTTWGLRLPSLVWDVHEDAAAALEVREWIPRSFRRCAVAMVRSVERFAERRMSLLLAEHQYAARFQRSHPVVANTTFVPVEPPGAGVPDSDGQLRVVYLGSVTMERGADELVAVGRMLRRCAGGRLKVQVIGPAHGSAVPLLEKASARGDLEWLGFLNNREALQLLDGALAGLSLLHDTPNFRPSMPTKVVEYMAHGVPVVTTPLPIPAKLVSDSRAGVIVPFGDPASVVRQLLAWAGDLGEAAEAGRLGHRAARDHLDWNRQAVRFVDALEQVLVQGASTRC